MCRHKEQHKGLRLTYTLWHWCVDDWVHIHFFTTLCQGILCYEIRVTAVMSIINWDKHYRGVSSNWIRNDSTGAEYQFESGQCPQIFGEMAEWLKAAVLKTVKVREGLLGFESQSFRSTESMTRWMSLFGRGFDSLHLHSLIKPTVKRSCKGGFGRRTGVTGFDSRGVVRRDEVPP